MDRAVTQPKTLPLKRKSRLRLWVLLITVALMLAVYLPLRTHRANEKLMQRLLLHDAAGVRDALTEGADPDLRLAPQELRGRPGTLLDFVRLILHRSLRAPTNSAKTALMYAANDSDGEMVSALLQHNANVNLRIDSGHSALMYAAARQSPEVVAALLAKGADTHAHTRVGETALLYAAQTGQTQNVRLLLAKGEDIHEIDLRSQTALSLATEGRHEETIRLLLTQGADARDLASAHPSPNTPVVRFTTSGPNRTVVTMNGIPISSQGGRIRRVPPQPSISTGLSPLAFAAKCGSPALLQFLWERSAPDVRQRAAWGLLCHTVQSGQIEAVRYLLDQNAPVNPVRDTLPTSGLTVLPTVRRQPGDYDSMRVYTPLHYAAALETPAIAALLIAYGANVNAADMAGTTPLLAAATGSHLETLRLLIAHGANVRAAERRSGQNALMGGVYRPEIVRLLLDHGLEINARDRTGRTALMNCTYPQISALLIARGADVNARDSQGTTALIVMSMSDRPECVALLLKHGANVHSVNLMGETPLSVSRILRSTAIITLLTAAGAKR